MNIMNWILFLKNSIVILFIAAIYLLLGIIGVGYSAKIQALLLINKDLWLVILLSQIIHTFIIIFVALICAYFLLLYKNGIKKSLFTSFMVSLFILKTTLWDFDWGVTEDINPLFLFVVILDSTKIIVLLPLVTYFLTKFTAIKPKFEF